jgi:hypothetical protein
MPFVKKNEKQVKTREYDRVLSYKYIFRFYFILLVRFVNLRVRDSIFFGIFLNFFP